MNSRFNRNIFVLALTASLAGAALAADNAAKPSPLDGTWRWNFTNADSGVIQPTLRVKTEDGKLTGISRFRSGSSTPVKNFTLKGDQVSFEVERTRNGETTVTRYRGTFKDDKINGKMISTWAGEEHTYDWNAFRFSDIEGVWKWRWGGGTNAPGGRGSTGGRRGGGFRGGGGGGEVTLTIKREDSENISGKINVGAGDLEIHEAEYKNGDLSFETERTRSNGELSTNYYWGKFSRDTIVGKFTTDAGGERRTNDFRATRAE